MNASLIKLDLLCTDVHRMATFYQALFAVPFVEYEMAGLPFRVGQVPGLGPFQLVPASLMSVAVSGLNRFQLNLELEDGTRLADRLIAAGGEVEEPPQRDGDRLLFHVKDPEGNSLVILCPDSTPLLVL